MNDILIFAAAAVVLAAGGMALSAFLNRRWGINARRRTPSSREDASQDFSRSAAPVVFGQILSSAAGPGTILGMMAAARYGWLPALVWLVFSSLCLAAVQNYAALLSSVRSGGRSAASIVQDRLGWRSGKWFLVISWIAFVLAGAFILELASGWLSGLVEQADGGSIVHMEQGIVTMMIFMLFPISIFIGFLNKIKCPVFISTVLALVFWGVSAEAGILAPLYLKSSWIVLALSLAALLAALLPVWMVAQPQTYLTSFLLYILFAASVVGLAVSRGQLQLPALTGWEREGFGAFPWLAVFLSSVTLTGAQPIAQSFFAARQLNNERNIGEIAVGTSVFHGMFALVVLLVIACTSKSVSIEGEPIAFFAAGLESLMKKAGLSGDYLLAARILLVYVLAASMTACLTFVVRTAVLSFQEIFLAEGEKQSFLHYRAVAAVLTMAAVWAAAKFGGHHLLRAAAIAFVLLIFPASMAMIAWMKRTGCDFRLLFPSAVISFMTAAAAMISVFVKDFRLITEEELSKKMLPQFAEIFLLILFTVTFGMFLIDGVRAYMKKRKIIFATGNPGKMEEIRAIMGDLDAEIVSMKEEGIFSDVVEDGRTFEENAIIKAKAISEKAGCLVLADDSGLEIDYLNKEPGVYSARYMGEDTPYTIKNNNLIQRLEGVPKEERTARFVCVIAAVFPDGRILTTRGTVEGYIGWEEKGENGFGYDPIFCLDEYNCTSAELSLEEKNKISHRGKALRAMKEKLA